MPSMSDTLTVKFTGKDRNPLSENWSLMGVEASSNDGQMREKSAKPSTASDNASAFDGNKQTIKNKTMKHSARSISNSTAFEVSAKALLSLRRFLARRRIRLRVSAKKKKNLLHHNPKTLPKKTQKSPARHSPESHVTVTTWKLEVGTAFS